MNVIAEQTGAIFQEPVERRFPGEPAQAVLATIWEKESYWIFPVS